MLPPLLLYVRIGTAEKPGTGWWLPLFLIWLLFLPVVVVVFLLGILADAVLILAGRPYHHYTLLLAGCLGMLSAARGTTVHINSEKNDVDIDFV